MSDCGAEAVSFFLDANANSPCSTNLIELFAVIGSEWSEYDQGKNVFPAVKLKDGDSLLSVEQYHTHGVLAFCDTLHKRFEFLTRRTELGKFGILGADLNAVAQIGEAEKRVVRAAIDNLLVYSTTATNIRQCCL